MGKTQPAHLVIERLATLAPIMPSQAVECVRLMCRGNTEGWMIQTWHEPIRMVLTTALQSPEANVREAAVELVNILSARGDLSFRDLLVRSD